jgi:hypothetical protein
MQLVEKGFARIIKKMVDVKDNAELNLLQVSEVAGPNADRRRLFYIHQPLIK